MANRDIVSFVRTCSIAVQAGGRGRRLCFMYLPTVRESTRMPSLSDSSSAMRPCPQLGFSLAVVRTSVCKFFCSGGHPGPRDFQRQNRRRPARCQRTSVLGLTIASAPVQGKNRLKATSASLWSAWGDVRRPCVPGRERAVVAENWFSAMISARCRNTIRTKSRTSAKRIRERAVKQISRGTMKPVSVTR